MPSWGRLVCISYEIVTPVDLMSYVWAALNAETSRVTVQACYVSGLRKPDADEAKRD
jgi:hypothetical protein